jgi:hypothetical protein
MVNLIKNVVETEKNCSSDGSHITSQQCTNTAEA